MTLQKTVQNAIASHDWLKVRYKDDQESRVLIPLGARHAATTGNDIFTAVNANDSTTKSFCFKDVQALEVLPHAQDATAVIGELSDAIRKHEEVTLQYQLPSLDHPVPVHFRPGSFQIQPDATMAVVGLNSRNEEHNYRLDRVLGVIHQEA